MSGPSNPELDALIFANPDDDATLRVYADWLTEQGDPRGEIAAVQANRLDRRAKELIDEHAATIFGDELARFVRAGREFDAEWRHGFLDGLWLGKDGRGDLASRYADLAGRPVARFLRRLGVCSADLAEVVRVMAARGLPPTLRCLWLRSTDDFWNAFLDELPALYASLTRLEELMIVAGHVSLGTIALPSLRRLEIETSFSQSNIASLTETSWPALRSLTLALNDDTFRFEPAEFEGLALAELDFGALSPERFPTLEHLTLKGPFGEGVIASLASSGLSGKLRHLALSEGMATDAVALRLLEDRDLFAHANLEIEENELSPENATELRITFNATS